MSKKELLSRFKKKIKTITLLGNCKIRKMNVFIFRRGKWDLPKGKSDIGETNKQTALREVIEETGIKELVIKNFFKTISSI